MKLARIWSVGLIPLLPLVAAACGPKPAPTPKPAAQVAELPAGATNTPEPSAASTGAPPPAPTEDPSINPLTGQASPDPAALRHRPILVRYGNDRAARPPSGLSHADVVFEEMVEAGSTTRITGVYLGALPDAVGPIRSARPAVIDLLQMVDGVLVYAGASSGTQALLNAQPYPLYSLVGRGSDLFSRLSSRPSPHNVYVSLPRVRERMVAEGVDQGPAIRGWVFSPTAPAGSPATRIHVPHPSAAVADYSYDAGSGSYLRSVEGAPRTDALDGKQLAPANVIVVYAGHEKSDIVEDSLGDVALLVNLSGEGRVRVFRDGVMVEGSWVREAPDQLLRLQDPSGLDIALKPGQTWVDIVPPDVNVGVQ